MRRVKKYPNGRLYDTIERKYLTPDLLSELIEEGAEILVFDTATGSDVTSETIGKLRRENLRREEADGRSLIQRLGNGGEAVTGRIGQYVSFLRNAFSGSESSEPESPGTEPEAAGNIRTWVKNFPRGFRRQIAKTIDRRLETVLSAINLATKDQVADLAGKITALNEKIGELEKSRTETPSPEISETRSYAAFPESSVEKRLHA